jgi:hypothetical protein
MEIEEAFLVFFVGKEESFWYCPYSTDLALILGAVQLGPYSHFWARFPRKKFGTVLGCCKVISLGCKCIVVADISFLKLIKSLSLSLGFPTLGFSLALPKFLSFLS